MSILRNILLLVNYEGTFFQGWQANKRNFSIEGALEEALFKLFGKRYSLQAASRTDAGVHALYQGVNFFLDRPFPCERLPYALNRFLPKGISVFEAQEKELSFHPTLDAKEKEYRYYVCLSERQIPFYDKTSWHIHCSLDIELIDKACSILKGKHDFVAFCNSKEKERYQDHICELTDLRYTPLEGNRGEFLLRGNRFLYRMARNLVGTLIAIGKKELPLDKLHEILLNKERKLAGETAPAHGLFLTKILWKQ